MNAGTADVLPALGVAIKAHTEEFAAITTSGGVAVFVFEPNAQGAKAAREMGWDKYGPPIFALRREHEQRLAMADTVVRRWIERPVDGVARLFAIVHGGTLLINWSEERGWWLQEGSTDTELKQTRS
jgi:hypothetical protein